MTEGNLVLEKKSYLEYLRKNRLIEIPSEGVDQYGNPVVKCNRNMEDPKSDWPIEIWIKKLQIEFILIPHGEFLMGSPTAKEDKRPWDGPQHIVRIKKPFYISKYEVTQAQWSALISKVSGYSDPSHFKGKTLPIEMVSWYDAKEFINKLSLFLKTGGKTRFKIRLPSEAEWEYACRAGTQMSGAFMTCVAIYLSFVKMSGMKTMSIVPLMGVSGAKVNSVFVE
jgi:formylglycine-generating enzyme required for sulfatase activity